ncbi:hypothetical protein [Candidatus Villigracilis saccharophilus]|uniref:hypothetical protein n=1 Tax=Candidatus Villigracilis saccharophilus TaxID=3140684 RepID=UPI0031374268|nr:hypothetical protein [Anaerolineales bacterium]
MDEFRRYTIPSWRRRQAVKFLMDNPEIAMVCADCDFINRQGGVIGNSVSRETDHHRLREGYVHIPCGPCFPRQILEGTWPLTRLFFCNGL